MRAGDRDARLQPHQFGEHFGAADDGNALQLRGDDFGVVALDGSRGHHHGGIFDVFGLLADEDSDAFFTQSGDDIAFGAVRSLHLEAQVRHHFGNAGHADAADADEVDDADIGAETGAQAAHVVLDGIHAGVPVAMTRSARRAAASG